MFRIFSIASKDLQQILRNRLTFLFLLIMPIGFTLLFGLAFSGSGSRSDTRLPVGYLDQDAGQISQALHTTLSASTVIRLDENPEHSIAELETLVREEKLAAAIIIPSGYSQSFQAGAASRLTFLADPANIASQTVEGEILVATNRLVSSVRTAQVVAEVPIILPPSTRHSNLPWQPGNRRRPR